MMPDVIESPPLQTDACDRLLALADGEVGMAWVAGTDKRCTFFNEGWRKFTGQTPEEESNTGCVAAVHPDDQETAWNTYAAAFDARRPYSLEYRARRHDGEYRWILEKGRPLFSEEGEFEGYAGTCVDITEQKRVAEELEQRVRERTEALMQNSERLRKAEERFELALRGTNLGLWDWNIVTGEDYFSEQWCALLGYVPGELETDVTTWTALLHPEERHWVLENVRQHLELKVPYDIEYRLRTKSGRYRWYHAQGKAVWDEQGKPLRMAGSIADVTERKEAEQALRESEEKFRLLTRSIPEVFWISEMPDFRVTYISPAYETVWRRSCESLYAHFNSLVESIHPEDQPAAQAMMDKLREGQRAEVEYRIFWPDGTARWIRDCGFPIKDGSGHVNRVCGISFDVTERKQQELLLRGQNQLLETVAQGASLNRLLNELTQFAESQVTGLRCSVLLMDASGQRLRHGAAPTLPEAYKQTVDGMAIGPRVGSCGTAAFLKEPVFVRDVSTDPLWADFREIARAHRLRACWSTPILSTQGEVLGTLALYHDEPRDPLPFERQLIQTATHVAGIAIERQRAKDSVMAYQDQLREMNMRLLQSEEQERRRVADEIHDEIGQNLAVCKMKLGGILQSLADSLLAPELRDVRSLIEKTIAETRSLSFQLSPPLLHELGLEPALQWLTEHKRQRYGLDIRFLDDGAPKPLSSSLRILLFRVARELLLNVVKHAQASRASLKVRRIGREIEICVEDDGVGFDPEVPGGKSGGMNGFGLFSIQDRLRQLGGCLRIDSKPGAGTRVTFSVPLSEEPSAGDQTA